MQKKVTLKIESNYDSETVTLKDEISIGRTPLADVVLKDEGLSHINTTIFRDGDEMMEREGILDALREGNLNACFHEFIYDDGKPPKM